MIFYPIYDYYLRVKDENRKTNTFSSGSLPFSLHSDHFFDIPDSVGFLYADEWFQLAVLVLENLGVPEVIG